MEEQNKQRKNHWTQTKVDEVAKRINNEIYSILLKNISHFCEIQTYSKFDDA